MRFSFSQIKLDIDIIDIRNNTGKIMLQLFNENEKVVTQEMSPIKEKKCSFSITNLKPGKYAVRYYMMKIITVKWKQIWLENRLRVMGFQIIYRKVRSSCF